MPMTVEEFHGSWLRGSTCFRKRRDVFWASECGNYVIMKHHGHSEYMGRWSKTERCGTYYALYDLRGPRPDCLGGPYVMKWKGRWKREYWEEVHGALGVDVDKGA